MLRSQRPWGASCPSHPHRPPAPASRTGLQRLPDCRRWIPCLGNDRSVEDFPRSSLRDCRGRLPLALAIRRSHLGGPSPPLVLLAQVQTPLKVCLKQRKSPGGGLFLTCQLPLLGIEERASVPEEMPFIKADKTNRASFPCSCGGVKSKSHVVWFYSPLGLIRQRL